MKKQLHQLIGSLFYHWDLHIPGGDRRISLHHQQVLDEFLWFLRSPKLGQTFPAYVFFSNHISQHGFGNRKPRRNRHLSNLISFFFKLMRLTRTLPCLANRDQHFLNLSWESLLLGGVYFGEVKWLLRFPIFTISWVPKHLPEDPTWTRHPTGIGSRGHLVEIHVEIWRSHLGCTCFDELCLFDFYLCRTMILKWIEFPQEDNKGKNWNVHGFSCLLSTFNF